MARKSQKARARKKNRSKNMSSHANRNVATASSPPKVALDVAIAQLDLSSSGGPFTRLPNELLEAILTRLDMQKLIHLQVVCKKWHAVVFLISQKKKSLHLTFYLSFKSQQGENIKIYKKRSFGLIDLKTFTKIELKLVNSDLPTQLNKLFPDIESFNLDMCSVSNWIDIGLRDFFPVLSQLHLNKLTTLSITIPEYSCKQTIVKLLTLINSFVSLKRLDITPSLKRKISLLGPTLARLEQFSYSSYEPSLVGLFGSNCARVSLDGFFENINFSQWHSNNAQWLATVTHLELKNVQLKDQHIDSLIVRAVSLKVLRLEATDYWGSQIRMTPQMIGYLAKMKHLTEIEMNQIIFELPQLDQAREDLQLAPLDSLRICTLSIRKLASFTDWEMDKMRKFILATVLSAIFPNVEHLNIAISDAYFQDLQGIWCYLDKFTKLQNHSFKQFEY